MEERELQIKNYFDHLVYIWTTESELRGKILRIEVHLNDPEIVAVEFTREGAFLVTYTDLIKLGAPELRDILSAILLGDPHYIRKVVKRLCDY